MTKNFKSKFPKVYNTPSLLAPIVDMVGINEWTQEAEHILQITYLFPPVVHPDIVEFFNHMQMAGKIIKSGPVNVETSSTDSAQFWKTTRKDLIFHANIHNRHYIASTTSPYISSILV